MASKNLQKSSAIQNISVTLSSVIIANFVCIPLSFNTIKVQLFSLITNFLSNYNSSNSRYSRKEGFKENPVILFIDEAHQFLNKRISADDDSSFYLQNIDSIAKETRKYGLFLCLATQMPRDIPIGTLSQMGTFIVHRLINEQDKKAVENAASSANRNVLQFLPILGEGEALLVGVDFPMPLMLKVDAPINKPNSSTPKLKSKKAL